MKTLLIVIGVVIIQCILELALTYLIKSRGVMPFKLKLQPNFELPGSF